MRSCPRNDRTVRWRAGLVSGALAFGSLAGACAAPPPETSSPDERDGNAPSATSVEEAPHHPLSGDLRTRYQGRFTGDSNDHDVYQTADLAYADPEGRWSGSFLARGAFDADGEDSQEFFGLLDTYEHRFEAQLFHAYVDVASRSLELLRFGRQLVYETPVTVLFDGVRAELAPRGAARIALGAYAGIGEHMYESSDDGDLVLGGFGAARAWEGAELRADWMRLEDARLGVDHENDLFGLVLSQDLARAETSTRMDARFTSLEGDGRDVRFTASHVDGGDDWSFSGSLYRLLQTQKSLAAPLDPFSDTLFELFPYTQAGVTASKDWRHFGLLSGVEARRVTDADDEGEYNRDFERYYLTGTLADALPVSIALTGEVWRAQETDYETWGAALARGFADVWEVSLASHYALYEYDLSSAEERDHVRSTTLDVRWKQGVRRWTLRYELERNDFDDFHQVTLDFAWGL